MLRIGDTVKVIAADDVTVDMESYQNSVGSICKVIGVAYSYATPVYELDNGWNYYERELEKGTLVWKPEAKVKCRDCKYYQIKKQCKAGTRSSGVCIHKNRDTMYGHINRTGSSSVCRYFGMK